MSERPTGRTTVLYDEDCGFCKAITVALLDWDRRGALDAAAIQSERGAALLADLPPERRLESVHVVSPSGERSSGGAALAVILDRLPGARAPARALRAMPRLADAGYALVASNRSTLSRLVPERAKARARNRLSNMP